MPLHKLQLDYFLYVQCQTLLCSALVSVKLVDYIQNVFSNLINHYNYITGCL